jgi:hypothetical protein
MQRWRKLIFIGQANSRGQWTYCKPGLDCCFDRLPCPPVLAYHLLSSRLQRPSFFIDQSHVQLQARFVQVELVRQLPGLFRRPCMGCSNWWHQFVEVILIKMTSSLSRSWQCKWMDGSRACRHQTQRAKKYMLT